MNGVYLLAALLGLTLPGYLLSRLLRREHPWLAAFPFSAPPMAESIGFSSTGIRVLEGGSAP